MKELLSSTPTISFCCILCWAFKSENKTVSWLGFITNISEMNGWNNKSPPLHFHLRSLIHWLILSIKRVLGAHTDDLPPYLTRNNGAQKQIAEQANKQSMKLTFISTHECTYINTYVYHERLLLLTFVVGIITGIFTVVVVIKSYPSVFFRVFHWKQLGCKTARTQRGRENLYIITSSSIRLKTMCKIKWECSYDF